MLNAEFQSLAISEEVDEIPVTEIVDNSTYVITFKELNGEIIQLSVEVNVHVSKCFNVKFQVIFFRASYLRRGFLGHLTCPRV